MFKMVTAVLAEKDKSFRKVLATLAEKEAEVAQLNRGFTKILATLAEREAEVAQLKRGLLQCRGPCLEPAAHAGQSQCRRPCLVPAAHALGQTIYVYMDSPQDSEAVAQPRSELAAVKSEGCTKEAPLNCGQIVPERSFLLAAQPKVELAVAKGIVQSPTIGTPRDNGNVAVSRHTDNSESDAQPCDELAFQSDWTVKQSRKAKRRQRKSERLATARVKPAT
jgi:hypothetical protein